MYCAEELLPVEVWARVLGYVWRDSDARALGQTSRALYSVWRDEHTWQRALLESSDSNNNNNCAVRVWRTCRETLYRRRDAAMATRNNAGKHVSSCRLFASLLIVVIVSFYCSPCHLF